ncbi:MAG: SpoIIE family protein phosphatase [Candidatus Krumholzibacteriota bacterium]|nr:SpoIIE family protein phosphatase [Candidatus Krumholzibacteriota bacterium]
MGMKLTAENKYRLMTRISHSIRDTLGLDEILNHLLNMVQSVLDYDAVGIFVLNEDIVYSRDRHPHSLIAGLAMRGFDMPQPTVDPMLVSGKGIIGHVIRTGESVIASDVREDPRYVEGRKGTLSEIAVPIVRKKRVIGALNLESNTVAKYIENDLEVLRFFADAASISIEKAMLHRQLLDKKLIEEQLKTAQHVQSRLLPDSHPDISGYNIVGTCIPTYEIGGDYYDYFKLPDGDLAIVVADVSGKGIPAALIMTAFRALLRANARSGSGPKDVIKTLKHLLPDFMGESNFVTSVYGVLNPAAGSFEYVNCGHHPPILFRSNGNVERLKDRNPLLSSALEDISRHSVKVSLAEGDLLLLYTDGVIEVIDNDGNEFGADRLEAVVQSSLRSTVSDIISNIIRATHDFAGTEYFTDDFTLVVLQRNQKTP